MPFDTCASGGRRNVLEMMRRGVPLSKTDYAGGTTSSQCQFLGLAPWLVQAFRRPQSTEAARSLKLRGLVRSARYSVSSIDDGSLGTFDGKTLMESGLQIQIAARPAAALILYSKVTRPPDTRPR